MNKIVIVSIILFSVLSAFSQTAIKKSTTTTVISGEKFYLHTVESGQTLYSICKTYGVSQKDIAKANSSINSGIKVGQVLKVPMKSSGKSTPSTFVWHKVKKQETLYSISKKYGISVNDIYTHNPDAKYGIKIDQVLKIPNTAGSGADYGDGNFYYHVVIPGDTPFSICQRYGTSYEQLYAFNPNAKNGLKVGEMLKVPKGNYDATEKLRVTHDNKLDISSTGFDPLYFDEPGVTPCSKYVYKPGTVFNVGVMLPLYISENASLSAKYNDEKDKLFYKNSKRFFEMYEGILLALQRLKIDGMSVNLYLYDTQKDAEEVKKIMRNPELKNLDLIIGPVYSSNIEVLSDFVKENKINLVTPLVKENDILKDNPFIYKVMPSDETRVKTTCDYLSKLYDSSIVIIHGGTPKELEIIDIYRRKLIKSFSSMENLNEISLKIIDYNHGGSANLEDALSLGYENIVLIPSEDEVFVTKIIERLNGYTKKYDISLFGPPSWELFENIIITHLRNLNFKYTSPHYVDYNNWRVKSVTKQYREVYKTDPSIYALQGYDIMYYFGTALMKYGKNFQFCLDPTDRIPNSKGLIHDFEFSRYGKNGGFENSGVFMLEYDINFALKKSE